ncbi:MAG: carboxylesterase/lipase family protein [Candidatus Hodarchaeales archaeon]|jgi:para-nitrobenzyl esterase
MEIMAIIETKSGKIQGYSENDVEVYKGIPYAEAPIGDLRFRPPVSKKSWDGVLEAKEIGSFAFQGYSMLEEYFGKDGPESEDCLYLNIWTPAADGEKRPVMFWIHGGAFITGGGGNPIYDGSVLAKRGDVVVVTINYRLGAFGYSYIPGETANVGQLDQIMALEWVRDNIEFFGGDPANVTIFGESAGGYAVLTLSAMPGAKGLFRRVIAQSAPFINPEVSDKHTKSLMRMLKLKKGDIEAFRKIPPEEIIDAQNKYLERINSAMEFRPLIDGESLPIHPLKEFQSGDCSNIDFMIGSNLDEAKMFTSMGGDAFGDPEKQILMFLAMFGIDASKSANMVETYKNAREGSLSTEPKDIIDAVITDFMFRIPTIRFLEAQFKHQKNTYNYLFTWNSPGMDGQLGCCHALEIAFVFNTLNLPGMDEFTGQGPEAELLSQKVMDAWIAFAHTGNPNHDGIPEWQSYDTEKRTTMLLGKDCKTVNAFQDKEREAWDGLLEV